MASSPANIIISRTDSIGDVVLTLPVARFIKEQLPGIKVGFLGKEYTRPVIQACKYVDEFIADTDFYNGEVLIEGKKPEAIVHVLPLPAVASRAKRLHIPLRIGTTNRIYHWYTCNKLVKLSRKNSTLHEAQLNIKLLEPFGFTREVLLQEVGQSYGLEKLEPLSQQFANLIDPQKYNLILHPKSQGSAREWSFEHFASLIKALDPTRYKIFISGTAKERPLLQALFEAVPGMVTDITGMMALGQFMAFINQCNGLLANSTGPLHIAAALGKDAWGIYPPMRPIHPGRWAPLGSHAQFFVVNKTCMDCKGNKMPCHCINEVPPQWIKEALDKRPVTISSF